MNRLLLYHDFASPFSRLAERVVAGAAERTGMTARAVPFELRPAPAPLPAPGELDATELETARSLAAEWDIELGELRHVPRTRKAHEAVAYARDHDAEAPVLRGLYDALWRDGLDISRLDDYEPEVVREQQAAAAAGLTGVPAVQVRDVVALGLDDYEPEVVREQQAAAAAGLTGVPAVQVRDVVAVGVFPLPELVEWIESNR